jgi:uncharacterized protein
MALESPTVDNRVRIPTDVINELITRIASGFQPEQIILFGSCAYGKPRPESDVDLLIVMETPLRETQQALQIRQQIGPLFGVDLIVITPARLEQRLQLGDSFLQEVVKNERVVYESAHT